MRTSSIARTAALAAIMSGATLGVVHAQQATPTPPGTPTPTPPDTGLGGDAMGILVTLAVSGAIALVGLRYALGSAHR
ncbi:hypothetical protein C4552_04390 [Candidatus Parcubacteria bacterium]|nr:MAG: hypothetical protein C4552_04390 [Candidatus Parcubacteria bacterium]